MVKLRLDPWQKEFLNTKGDKILCTGRQVGKSVVCGKDAGDWAINNPKSNILMIAPTERQAYALFRKTLSYLVENYPYFISEGKERPTREKIILTNGTEIYCLPVGLEGVGIRFITVHRLYIDEASRVPEAVFDAITPALLTTGGDTIMLSTPFGKQGEFYRCWINEDNKYNSFTRFSIDSEKVMREREICESWTIEQREKALEKLQRERLRMSAKMYAQEYLGEFVDALFRLFNEDLLKKCMRLKRPQNIAKGKYYLGCDIARLGGDEITYEIIKKIDENNYEHVENIYERKQLLTDTYDRIIEINRIWKPKKIGIDAGSGSLGVAILDFLMRETSTRDIIVPLTNQRRVVDSEGKRTARLLKEDMYMNLLAMMERGELSLLDDQNVLDSLRSVNYEYGENDNSKVTTIKIYGNYTHIAEGLIRAAWLAKQDKSLNLFITYSNDKYGDI